MLLTIFSNENRQLGSISEFMVNTYCDQQPELKEAFGFLAFFRVIDQSDAQCFRVQSDIEIGFYFIAAATLLLAFVNTFIKRAADSSFGKDPSCFLERSSRDK